MISIHALRKESDMFEGFLLIWIDISIHALRKESDPQSRSRPDGKYIISIHALRKESDFHRFPLHA